MVDTRMKDYHFKGNEVNFYNRRTKYRVVPGATPGMYYIRFRDGTWSKDYYNLSHAKDNCLEVAVHERRNRTKIKGDWYSPKAKVILKEMSRKSA